MWNLMFSVAMAQSLSVGAVIPGQTLDITVTDLIPSESVTVVGSTAGLGSGPCPAGLGGICADVLSPVVLGVATANFGGTATVSTVVPIGLASDQVAIQAVATRSGGDAVKSPAVLRVVGDTKIVAGYMVVHLEPNNPPVAAGRQQFGHQQDHFPDLVDLVTAADIYGHELTIMFTANWASYIQTTCAVPEDGDGDGSFAYQGTEYSSCTGLVAAFEAYGHEVALHHHQLGAPAVWDGYTGETSWEADRDGDGFAETHTAATDPWHLGDMEDAHDEIEGLATAPVVSATTSEQPAGILYSAGGGGNQAYLGPSDWEDRGGLVSQPCVEDYGHAVWDVRMRKYSTTGIQATVLNGELDRALVDHVGTPATDDNRWTMGFVTHASNVPATSLGAYEDLFEALSIRGIQLGGLADVMGEWSWTSDDPALSSRICPDYPY